MAKNDQKIKKEGVVIENLPNGFFKVELDNDEGQVLAHLAGKLRVNKIRVLLGDRVVVEMTPYDSKRGRIIYRKKWE